MGGGRGGGGQRGPSNGERTQEDLIRPFFNLDELLLFLWERFYPHGGPIGRGGNGHPHASALGRIPGRKRRSSWILVIRARGRKRRPPRRRSLLGVLAAGDSDGLGEALRMRLIHGLVFVPSWGGRLGTPGLQSVSEDGQPDDNNRDSKIFQENGAKL